MPYELKNTDIGELTPAYGRDYNSAKSVKADWDLGKDFVISSLFHPNSGSYINKADAVAAGIKSVLIRYARLTKIVKVKC